MILHSCIYPWSLWLFVLEKLCAFDLKVVIIIEGKVLSDDCDSFVLLLIVLNRNLRSQNYVSPYCECFLG
jgi:hypothetical protein